MTRSLMILGVAVVAAAGVPSPRSRADLQKVAKLRNPAALTEKAPATYKANFDTSKGTFVIRCTATGRRSAPTASTTSSRTASTTTCGSSA